MSPINEIPILSSFHSVEGELVFDLCGSALTPNAIAMIVTALEEQGSLHVCNVGKDSMLPGRAAMTLGMMLEKIARSD